MALAWASAGTDEPGDQNADSAHVPDGCTSAYYSLGPNQRWWAAELIGIRDGEEISGAGVYLGGRYPNEAAAKVAAEHHESAV